MDKKLYAYTTEEDLSGAVPTEVVSYSYGADGMRIQKMVGEETSNYYYANGQLAYEKRGEKEFYYLYDSDTNLASIRYIRNGSSTTYYAAVNSRGDTEALYNGSGNLVARYLYDSWGNMVSVQDGTGNEITEAEHIGNANPIRYRGYYYDAETGWYYLGSRYYDPEVGRFISADTTDILGVDSDLYDKNLYAYCDNNPVMRKDSSGELWIAAIAVGVATQYAGDVIGNLLTGKTGADIFIPTSSIGEYIAAGVTALIPGSGITGSLARNITSETIISVERHVTGKSNNLRSFVTNVASGTLIDSRVESVSNRATKYIRSKTSKNYSQYANTIRKKNPNASTNTIRKSAQKSVRWGNRLAKGIGFVFNSIRSALPW